MSDMFARTRGFRVEITQGAGTGSDVDSAWETCSGGSLNIEIADSSVGTDRVKTVSPVVLSGPLAPGREWIAECMEALAAGIEWLFDMTITEILSDGSVGRVFEYGDCFITGYKYPVTSTTGTVQEEVKIKPLRFELK